MSRIPLTAPRSRFEKLLILPALISSYIFERLIPDTRTASVTRIHSGLRGWYLVVVLLWVFLSMASLNQNGASSFWGRNVSPCFT